MNRSMALARGGARWRSTTLVAALAAMLMVLAVAATSASAVQTQLLNQTFETGGTNDLDSPDGLWTRDPDPTSSPTNLWHAVNQPQTHSILSPTINPDLVTLPDSGTWPSAFAGSNVASFNINDSNGSFCYNYTAVTQSAKNGCESDAQVLGKLVSPKFDFGSATTSILYFQSLFGIEAVDADSFDEMEVVYRILNTANDPVVDWTPVGELNPASNPAGADEQEYTNNGLLQPASYKQVIADLTPAIQDLNDAKVGDAGSRAQIGFSFHSNDRLFQGFLGWFLDNVSLETPYNAPDPVVTSVDVCSGTSNAPITVLHGQNFVLGSKVIEDGQELQNTQAPASDRIEIPAIGAGEHSLQVKSPNGALSNVVKATGGACAPPTVTPAATPPPPPPPPPIPNSNFTQAGSPKVLSGYVIQLLLNAPDPGDFGVGGGFTAFPKVGAVLRSEAAISEAKKAKKCKKGQKKKGKKCIKKAIFTYGPAAAHAAAPGPVTVSVLPSASTVKYLNKGKNAVVVLTERFQSALGGLPTTKTQTVTVKGKKPAKKCKKGFKRKGKRCVKKK